MSRKQLIKAELEGAPQSDFEKTKQQTKMKYNVIKTITITRVYEIEANSIEQARDLEDAGGGRLTNQSLHEDLRVDPVNTLGGICAGMNGGNWGGAAVCGVAARVGDFGKAGTAAEAASVGSVGVPAFVGDFKEDASGTTFSANVSET